MDISFHEDGFDTCSVLQNVLTEISRFRNLGRCSAMLLEQEKQAAYVLASSDAPAHYRWQLDLANYPELLEVARTASPVIVRSVRKSPLMAPVANLLSDQKFQSILIFPALVSGQVAGAIVLRFPEEDPQVTQEEFFFFQQMSVLFAQILQKTIISTGTTLPEEERFKHVYRGMKERDDFIFRAINAMRAPITAIHGFCSLIHEVGLDNLNQDQKDYLEKVIGSCEDMSSLIHDLMDLSHFVSGRTRMNMAPRDLRIILAYVEEKIRGEARRKKVHLQWCTPQNDCFIMCDAAGIQRVIYGLAENALRLAPVGGQVQLTVQENADQVNIHIEDDGQRLSREDLAGLHVDYGSLDTDPDNISGCGVSFSLFRAIIEDHRGHLTVESGTSRGNRYSFALPRSCK